MLSSLIKTTLVLRKVLSQIVLSSILTCILRTIYLWCAGLKTITETVSPTKLMAWSAIEIIHLFTSSIDMLRSGSICRENNHHFNVQLNKYVK